MEDFTTTTISIQWSGNYCLFIINSNIRLQINRCKTLTEEVCMCHQAYIYFTITAVWFTDKSSVLECSTNCLFMLQYYSKLSHLNFCYEQSLLDFFISTFFYFLLLTLSVTENWWVSAEILYVWSLVGTTVIKYWNIWLSRRKKKNLTVESGTESKDIWYIHK